jgi:tRNA nucleotidyltransferase (CCA-adding enzyme)
VRAATGAEAKPRRWEHFPHGADIGVRGFGKTPAEAFEAAAFALTGIVTDAPIGLSDEVSVSCEAPDLELLLVDWLNAIIYEMAVRNMLFGRFQVEINGTHLHARMWGERTDQTKHAPAVEPKGATFTALRVAMSPDGIWSAGCIIDV